MTIFRFSISFWVSFGNWHLNQLRLGWSVGGEIQSVSGLSEVVSALAPESGSGGGCGPDAFCLVPPRVWPLCLRVPHGPRRPSRSSQQEGRGGEEKRRSGAHPFPLRPRLGSCTSRSTSVIPARSLPLRDLEVKPLFQASVLLANNQGFHTG